MPFNSANVIVSHRPQDLWEGEYSSYVAHVLCLEGDMTFTFYGSTFTLKAGEGMIVRCASDVHDVKAGNGLILDMVFVTPDFIEVCTPRNNYGIKGSLSLHDNPVMSMDEARFRQLQDDFSTIEKRLANKSHLFQTDIIICATQTMFLDFFDAHACKTGDTEVSFQNTDILSRFMQMLQRGDYVEHREVSYYADKLFVTPKYLSEVCKDVSGMTANYWITRFTTIHIRRLLQDKKLTFTQISDMFQFSSLAYFSRFVVKNLGAPPSKFRE